MSYFRLVFGYLLAIVSGAMKPGVPAFGKKLSWPSKLANLKSMMNALVWCYFVQAMMLLGEIYLWTMPRLWSDCKPIIMGNMIFLAVVYVIASPLFLCMILFSVSPSRYSNIKNRSFFDSCTSISDLHEFDFPIILMMVISFRKVWSRFRSLRRSCFL